MAEPDPRFELVLDEARRGLTEQQGSIEQARSRAATLLGASAIVTAFLGGSAAGGDTFWLVAACASFAFCGISCAVVLAPWTFTFVGSVDKLVADRITGPDAVDLDGMRWAVAQDLERWRKANVPTVQRLWAGVTCACVGFIAEVLCLLVLAQRGSP